uniref:Acetylcholine receptor-like protein cup-4 n=1 Tax=Cacopsylla melanoneura TaxID=428564 RepID=A0A8D8Q7Y2_9HEMI
MLVIPRTFSVCALLIGTLSHFPLNTRADTNCSKSYAKSPRLRLEKCILDNYQTNLPPSRPTKKLTNTTEIDIEYAAMDIQFISKYKLFYLKGFIKVEWNDPYLAWNPTDYGGLYITQIDSGKIWTPPLVQAGIPGSPYSSIFSNTVTDVKHNGSVSYMNFMSLPSLCTSHLKQFPRDEHECVIQLESPELIRIHLGNEDGLHPTDDSIRDFVNMLLTGYSPDSLAFQLMNVTLKTTDYEFSTNNTITTSFNIHTTFRRKTSLLSVIHLKAFSLGLLTMVPLFLPVSSLHRMGLPLITFYGSVYAIDRIDDIINIYTAEDVPFIIIYYRNIILIALFILSETLVCLLLSEYPLQLSPTLETFYTRITTNDYYDYVDTIRSFYNVSTYDNESLVITNSPKKSKRHTYKEFMQLVDTFLAVLIVLIMCIFYLLLI